MKYTLTIILTLLISLGLNAQYAAKITRLSSQTPTIGTYAIQGVFSSDEGFVIGDIDNSGSYYYIDNNGTQFVIVEVSNVSAPIITFEFDNILSETTLPSVGSENMVATKNTVTNQYYIASNLSKGFTAKFQRLNVSVEQGSGGSAPQTAAEVPFTPVTNITSINVQAALVEVQAKVTQIDGDYISITSDVVIGGAKEFVDDAVFSGNVDFNGSVISNLYLDEDNMVSNSATRGATQQSIKAYVDASVSNNIVITQIQPIDFALTLAGTNQLPFAPISVPGLLTTDRLIINFDNAAMSGIGNGMYQYWISAPGQIRIKFINNGTTDIDPAAGNATITVLR